MQLSLECVDFEMDPARNGTELGRLIDTMMERVLGTVRRDEGGLIIRGVEVEGGLTSTPPVLRYRARRGGRLPRRLRIASCRNLREEVSALSLPVQFAAFIQLPRRSALLEGGGAGGAVRCAVERREREGD